MAHTAQLTAVPLAATQFLLQLAPAGEDLNAANLIEQITALAGKESPTTDDLAQLDRLLDRLDEHPVVWGNNESAYATARDAFKAVLKGAEQALAADRPVAAAAAARLQVPAPRADIPAARKALPHRWEARDLPKIAPVLKFVEPLNNNPIDPSNVLMTPDEGGILVKTSEGAGRLGLPMWANKTAFDRLMKLLIEKKIDFPTFMKMPVEEVKELIKDTVPLVYVHEPLWVAHTMGHLGVDFIDYMKFMLKIGAIIIVPPEYQDELEAFTALSYMGDRVHDLNLDAAHEHAESELAPLLADEIAKGFKGSPDADDLRRIVTFTNGECTVGKVTYRRITRDKIEIVDNNVSLGIVDMNDLPNKPVPVRQARKTDDLGQFDEAFQDKREFVLETGGAAVIALGTGHGFDTKGYTSGFMYWNNGKCILVDPPSHTLKYFYENGIPLDCISGVIVTHGHTDHFGDAIPQLLEVLPRIPVYGTRTGYSMLMMQYLLAFGATRKTNFEALIADFRAATKGKLKGICEKALGNKHLAHMTALQKATLFVDIFMACEDDPRLAAFQTRMKSYLTHLGVPGLFDWAFQEIKPQEFTNINGMDWRFTYSFHTIASIGFEIWNKGHMVHYFSGDTFAATGVFDKIKKEPDDTNPDHVMTIERALDILRHYFLIPLFAKKRPENLIPDETNEVTIPDVVRLLTDEKCPVRVPQEYAEALTAYLMKWRDREVTDGTAPTPSFFIEGGVPPIHIPPTVTRDFLNYLNQELIIRDANGTPVNVYAYHIGDGPAREANLRKPVEGIKLFEPDKSVAARAPYNFRYEAIRRVPALRQLTPREIDRLIHDERVKEVRIDRFNKLIEDGAMADKVYILLDGEVHVSKDGQMLERRFSGVIGEAALFGRQEKRNADVVALVNSTFLEMDAEVARQLLGTPQVLHDIKHLREVRAAFSQGAFANSPLENLPKELQDELLLTAKVERYTPGEKVLVKGDHGRDIYALAGGTALVAMKDGKTITLRPQALMGEMAYVFNTVRTTDVMAGGDGMTVVRFPAAALDRLAEKYPGLTSTLRRLANERSSNAKDMPRLRRPSQDGSPASARGASSRAPSSPNAGHMGNPASLPDLPAISERGDKNAPKAHFSGGAFAGVHQRGNAQAAHVAASSIVTRKLAHPHRAGIHTNPWTAIVGGRAPGMGFFKPGKGAGIFR